MKTLMVLASILLSFSTMAAVLRQGGEIVHCNDQIDVDSHKTGYQLMNPKIENVDGKLNITLDYLVAECRNVNGNFAFYPVAKVNTKDKIILENSRLFSVDSFFGALKDEAGDSSTTISLPVNSIMTKKQSRKLANGNDVEKTLWVRYGNYFSGAPELKNTSYGLSSGYYTLTISVSNDSAVVKSFVLGKK